MNAPARRYRDEITDEERRLIDEAIARAKVTRCPTSAVFTGVPVESRAQLKYNSFGYIPPSGPNRAVPNSEFHARRAKARAARRGALPGLVAGMTAAELAAHFGVTEAVIYADLRDLGLQAKRQRRRTTARETAERENTP